MGLAPVPWSPGAEQTVTGSVPDCCAHPTRGSVPGRLGLEISSD
jgi:hypothetical protein